MHDQHEAHDEIPTRFQGQFDEVAGFAPSPADEVMAFAAKYRDKRVVATPVIVAACVVMFVVVTIASKSIMSPSGPVMIDHGANFGPLVVFDHETWRLLTNVFLHFGLVHLGFNLWCLSSAGPMLERFLGSFWYAALYLFAGLGGSIASLWTHPAAVGAGASGAIFGVFGGLLGFLAVRKSEVPTAVLQPMRSGTLAFIFYNVVLGFSSPTTDNAAHLGGLATGFVTGLLLTAAGSENLARQTRLVARLIVLAVIAGGLYALEQKANVVARKTILADPRMGKAVRAEYLAAPAFNAFNQAAQPAFQELDKIGLGVQALLGQLTGTGLEREAALQDLDRLDAQSHSLALMIQDLPADEEDIVMMRSKLASVQDRQKRSLAALRKIVEAGDVSLLGRPDGPLALQQAYARGIEEFGEMRQEYFLKYGLQPEPKPSAKPDGGAPR